MEKAAERRTARPRQDQPGGEIAPPRGPRQRGAALVSVAAPLLTIGALVCGWEMVRRVGGYPAFILPAPDAVVVRLSQVWADGTLTRNTGVTLAEAAMGFGLALALALPLGYAIARVTLLEIMVTPLIAASQAVPAVAIAPLLVLWLGTGLAPKVAIVAIIVFFPLLVTTVAGLRGVERSMLEVARVYGATWWQTFWNVEAPLAAPSLLSGLKLGLTLSLTGAVVGEFLGADSGLGYLINWSRESGFDTALLFATLIVLIVVSTVLYGAVSLHERYMLQWRD